MAQSPSPHDSRNRIRSTIEEASHPLTVEELAEQSGLHINTVRGHLGVLLAAGLVTREPAEVQGRGRPRWLYRAAKPQASPYRFLAEALTAELARAAGPSAAPSAAQRWAKALPALPMVHSPDEAVEEAADALNRLGFDAVASPLRDAISVSGCLYGGLVADNPVICDIHTALVVQLLEQTGQPVGLESMDVMVSRDVCVARLRRPDLAPTRRITAEDVRQSRSIERTDS